MITQETASRIANIQEEIKNLTSDLSALQPFKKESDLSTYTLSVNTAACHSYKVSGTLGYSFLEQHLNACNIILKELMETAKKELTT